MYKRFKLYTPVICVLMSLCAVLVLITPFFNTTLFYLSVIITLLTFTIVLIMLRLIASKTRTMLKEIGDGIKAAKGGNLADFPMPVMTVYDGSEIVWYNDLCAFRVFGGKDMLGQDVSEIFPELDVSETFTAPGFDISYGERRFTALVSKSEKTGDNTSVVYFIDDTSLKLFADEYLESKPSIVLVMMDNYEELVQDLKENERASVISGIESEIEHYFKAHGGLVIRIQRDRYFVIIEERGIRGIIENKFDLLDRVRTQYTSGRMNATLSIGVGGGLKTLSEAEGMARQALDMCLGRGGDQAAVRTQNGYDFYGGISKGIEKRTKVKTRIIANALSELIESSSNVLIMGHRFADLDCLGASAGLIKSVADMGKPCAICINSSNNLVRPLINRMLAAGYTPESFVEPEDALSLVGDKTLLIVVDTHVPSVLESEELYLACKNVVVIDHHRKLVQYIDNAVIFYHEPYASSVSEMVAELVQYFPKRPQITKTEAEAMLAGIMLDTKNFVLRTGVRTFEAAAYLRRLGADTVEVRKLFASTMEAYQLRSNLVASAEIYKNCAVASMDSEVDGIKLAAPQAADELLNISGVEASFVIFCCNSSVNVSARSMGDINVQVIMEKLGGGGHHTMAAAQFSDESPENVRKIVMEAIDEYRDTIAEADNRNHKIEN